MTGLSLFFYSFTRYSSLRAFSLNEKTGSVQDHISTRFFVFFSRISLHIFIRVFFLFSCWKMSSSCFVLLSLSLSHFAFSQSVHLHAAEWTARSIVATFSLSVCVPSLFFSNWKNLRQRKKKRLRSSGLVYIISNRPRTCESSASTRPRTDGDWRERESRTFQHIPPFFFPSLSQPDNI